MRSRTGCETCRQRKLKCDENKPICNRCRKARRPCVQGSIFRHSDGPDSVNVAPPVHVEHHEDQSSKQFTFVHVNNPCLDEEINTEGGEETLQSVGTTTQESATEQALLSRSRFTLSHEILDSTEASVADLESAINSELCSPAQQTETHIASIQDSAEFPDLSFQQNHSDLPDGGRNLPADPVLSIQLLWYFKAVPGKWMDLFDVTAYFAYYIPRLAATEPLLQSACCALASKHILRLLSHRPGSPLPHLHSDYWSKTLTDKNWQFESAAYYDDAIHLLMDSLEKLRHPAEIYSDRSFQSEVTLAAIAIPCMYELLEAPGPEWTAHMSALPLLETAPAQILDTLPTPPSAQESSRRSVFWNFVRQDYLYAFIHGTCTRLNPDDPNIWREGGLLVDDNGSLQPNYALDMHDEASFKMDEDLISHALFWILSKIVNFTADLSRLHPADSQSLPLSSNFIQQYNQISAQWTRLDTELQSWKVGLPPAFFPCVRTSNIASTINTNTTHSQTSHALEIVTYTIPTCGSTMQNYHMALILLLTNKPPDLLVPSNFTQRLNSYRAIQKEIIQNSREIYGISLSDPPESVRIQAVQPLFVAGQCLVEEREREVVIGLLRGVEEELGWATGYRVKELVKGWGRTDL